MLFWQTSRRESRDRIRSIRERPVCLPYTQVADVRVHDQFHTQAQTFTWEIHDELCAGKLHYTTGIITRHSRYPVALSIIYLTVSLISYRWLPIERPKRLYFAPLTSLKCPRRNTAHNTTCTDWSKTNLRVLCNNGLLSSRLVLFGFSRTVISQRDLLNYMNVSPNW